MSSPEFDPVRASFEVYFIQSRRNRGAHKRPTFERLPDGTYADDHIQRHWWTWQNACKVPAGMRLLPEEATQEMLEAAVKSANGDAVYKVTSDAGLRREEAQYAECYEAMLAVAPKVTTLAASNALTLAELQQKALDSGFQYGRAPDDHWVECTPEQAVALLQDLLNIRVDLTPQSA